MMLRRRIASARWALAYEPSPSGPRCASRALTCETFSSCAGVSVWRENTPAMPHMICRILPEGAAKEVAKFTCKILRALFDEPRRRVALYYRSEGAGTARCHLSEICRCYLGGPRAPGRARQRTLENPHVRAVDRPTS